MGLYPGAINMSTVLLDPNSNRCGAVAVGLGEPAGLSVGALRRTLRRGFLAFVACKLDQSRSARRAATRAERPSRRRGRGRPRSQELRSGAASETQAIIAGLAMLGARPIEIIEVYEDRA